MIEFLTSLPKDSALIAIIIALSIFGYNVIVQMLKNRSASEISTNDMSLKLLAELRLELDRIKLDNDSLRRALQHARALAKHLELVLGATTDADRQTAENAAKVYLDSIRGEL